MDTTLLLSIVISALVSANLIIIRNLFSLIHLTRGALNSTVDATKKISDALIKIESDTIRRFVQRLSDDGIVDYASFDPKTQRFKYSAKVFKWYHVSEATPSSFDENVNKKGITVIVDTPYGIHECLYQHGMFYPPKDIPHYDDIDIVSYNNLIEWWMTMPERIPNYETE